MPFDLTETDRLLSTTRSVRKRLDLDRPVEREVLLECIRLAVQAPTGGNTQTWRWLVIDDPDTKAEIGELYRRMAERYLPLYRQNPLSDQTVRVIDSADYLGEVMGRAPALVIPCSKGRPDDSTLVGASSFWGSVIPAIWSFQLALRSRGLGSCYTTLHLAQEKKACDVLGIPDDVTQIALLPVAYTKGDEFQPAARGPVEHITYWNRWKATVAPDS